MQQQKDELLRVFSSLLQDCLRHRDLAMARKLQRRIISSGSYSNPVLRNGLIRAFSACGSLPEGKRVFLATSSPDAYAWEAYISAHVACGRAEDAIALYHVLRSAPHVEPNDHIYVASLKACCASGSTGVMISNGNAIHRHILLCGSDPSLQVRSILLAMYLKCGCVAEATDVFDRMNGKDVVAWNTMIIGYSQHGFGKEALRCLDEMLAEGILPDSHTFSGLFKVCASSESAAEEGKRIHSLMVKAGYGMNLFVANALIDMYGKPGLLSEAKQVFHGLAKPDAVSWTALMNAHGSAGDWKMAIVCFEQMQEDGIAPDGTAFKCLLNACSHAEQFIEGQLYFMSMEPCYGITASEDHIMCMVDLLARSGELCQAERLLLGSHVGHDVGWTALLSSCKKHGNVEVGRRCFDHAIEINPRYGSGYSLMSGIYADAGMWEHVEEIEELRRQAMA